MYARRLKARRKEMKIKQKELATKLGLTITHLCQLENEKTTPTLKTLNKWCKSLDCELNIDISIE